MFWSLDGADGVVVGVTNIACDDEAGERGVVGAGAGGGGGFIKASTIIDDDDDDDLDG